MVTGKSTKETVKTIVQGMPAVAVYPWLLTRVLFAAHAASGGVPSMTTAWRWKSSIQPDDGEGLAKRKGVIARWGLKTAWSKAAARWTNTG
jgi:hypothetical protein